MGYATADDGAGGTRLESFARAALERYALSEPISLHPLAFGLNAAFEVRTGAARYVLRVHRTGYRTPAQIRSELEFVRAVGPELAGDPELPLPVAGRQGELVVEVDYGGERRSCDLMTWLDGETVAAGAGLELDNAHALGRALGRLHEASARFRPAAGFDLPCWDAAGMLTAEASPFLPTLGLDDVLAPKDRAAYDEIADRTNAGLDELGRGADTFGVIHFDYILGNCFVRRAGSGWNVGVFDFDDCGLGYFLYDLAPVLGNFAGYPGRVPDNPDYPRLRDAFVAGYRAVRPFPDAWLRHLPVLIAARNAGHCLLTARPDVSPTPAEDAAWRMDLARRSLALPV